MKDPNEAWTPGGGRSADRNDKATFAVASNSKNNGYSTTELIGKATLPSVESVQNRVVFLPAFAKRLPLKLGVHQDLIALGLSKQAVRRFLRFWCARRDYLKALARGRPRYDLQGYLRACQGQLKDHKEAALEVLHTKALNRPNPPLEEERGVRNE